MPVTIPVDEPMVATVVAAFDHVPAIASLNVIVKPRQTFVGPVMAAGEASTVTVLDAVVPHPVE